MKQAGDALRYARGQTEEIFLTAVKQNGYALEYVEDNSMLKDKSNTESNKSTVMSEF